MLIGRLIFWYRYSKIDEAVTQNIMYDSSLLEQFKELPQEIAYEIFGWIPEYGHRINKELHERSLCTAKISIYCDFLRYCARWPMKPLDICIDVLKKDDLNGSKELSGSKDLINGAIKYLTSKIQDLVCEYLYNVDQDLHRVFKKLGIINSHKFSEIEQYDYEGNEIYVKQGYTKIIELYSLMILCDNCLLTKKEFERRCSETSGLAAILGLILTGFADTDHIYLAVIRYFGRKEIMTEVIERLEDNTEILEDLLRCLSYPKVRTSLDRNGLMAVREQLLDKMPTVVYHDSGNDNVDFRRLIFMIESLADEE